jgi:hypothetical protein
MTTYVPIEDGGCAPTGATVVRQSDLEHAGRVVASCPTHALVKWVDGTSAVVQWTQLVVVYADEA